MMFGDKRDMGSLFKLPYNAKHHSNMKATTFNTESTALQSVIALAEKALELLTSTSLTLISGIVAVFAIMAATINHNWSTFHTVAVITFAVIMALSMTVDIEKGGVK